jgi:hypothetical protein
MLEELFKQIPKKLLKESGEVFYSGKNAFTGKKKIYILGINPGGSKENHKDDTIEKQAKKTLNISKKNPNWSEYKDGQWEGKESGSHVFQIRINKLLEEKLKLSPYEIPASNLVFVRSPREGKLDKKLYKEYAELCWSNFHEKIVSKLDVKIIICLGNTPGNFVRKKLNMKKDPIDSWEENNNRKWKTKIYENDKKQKVIILPHPSVSDWTTKECDPSKIILKHIR